MKGGQIVNERIKELRSRLGLTQEEFSSKIGLSRNFIAQIETGTKKPSERTIFDICEKFNVNQDWLRTGNGEMFVELSKDEQISAMLGEIQRLGDENFKYRLVSALCKLSESDWTALENLVDMISDKK
jgi:transcriptional regulator with XRE-family HTH domain|nr:MAG TPA: helix-turn-helix domain protein [Caudoviricetes sp.]DAW61146.1 MAG TPA: helix-turn-helix domain protein [Caudoviricetes sp.]DAY03738.1 MAG TPA: helix-turn-helix domain protein [Caudoviricetes sp.]